MNIGMLWFDNDPRDDLDAKIARAAAYYRDKYGRAPTLCFVHPSMLRNGRSKDLSKDLSLEPGARRHSAGKDDPVGNDVVSGKNFAACGVEIRPDHSVLPNHFWIGVNGVS